MKPAKNRDKSHQKKSKVRLGNSNKNWLTKSILDVIEIKKLPGYKESHSFDKWLDKD